MTTVTGRDVGCRGGGTTRKTSSRNKCGRSQEYYVALSSVRNDSGKSPPQNTPQEEIEVLVGSKTMAYKGRKKTKVLTAGNHGSTRTRRHT